MRKLVLLLLVAACGDDGVRHTPDAAPHDGAVTPDGPVDGPSAGAVTITTTRDGQPVTGVQVYFQNADSTLVLATTTDATGTATAVMLPGGSVTAIDPSRPAAFGVSADELDTFTGVKPGDHLQLAAYVASAAIQVTIEAPDAVGTSGVTSYYAYSSCGEGGQGLGAPPMSLVAAPESSPMTLYNCGATADFLIVALDSTGPSQLIYAPGIAVSDGATVDLTASTYTAGATRAFTFNNVPGQSQIFFNDNFIGAQGFLYSQYNETPSGATNPTLSMMEPIFTGAGSVVRTTYSGAGGLDVQELSDWGPWAATFTTDVGARSLYNYNAPPSFDPATHAAAIGEDTSAGLAPDFTTFQVSAARASRNWNWNVAAPYGASVTLPTLPTDAFDFNIAAGDSPSLQSWATGKVPGGYDAARGLILSALASNGRYDLDQGSTGSATIVYLQSATDRTARPGSDKMNDHAHATHPAGVRRRVR